MCYASSINTAIVIIGILCAVGIIANIFLQLRKQTPIENQKDWNAEIMKLENAIQIAQAELSENAGKSKRMFIELEQTKAKVTMLEKERENLQGKVTMFEAKKEHQEKEYRHTIEKLEAAQQALKEERQRVIQEDELRRKKTEEERDRLWAEHENAVIATLSDLCKQPQFQFTHFSNTSLPDDFDGSLKPDFLLEFVLGQYVIFDAKVSKAQSLQTYIDDAVKKTADKVKKNAKIYPHIFLVVPTEAIGELKKLVYPKDGYYFYIVSREALAPILSSLKRISLYEVTETLDPQKRENIINMLAELCTHISYRNAHEIILSRMGSAVLEKIEQLDPEISAEVEQKKAEKKVTQLAAAEIKRLTGSFTEQNLAIQQLTSPHAPIKKKYIDAAESVITQKLL